MRFRLVEEKEFYRGYQNKEHCKNDKPVAFCEGCPKCKYADSSENNNGLRRKVNK